MPETQHKTRRFSTQSGKYAIHIVWTEQSSTWNIHQFCNGRQTGTGLGIADDVIEARIANILKYADLDDIYYTEIIEP